MSARSRDPNGVPYLGFLLGGVFGSHSAASGLLCTGVEGGREDCCSETNLSGMNISTGRIPIAAWKFTENIHHRYQKWREKQRQRSSRLFRGQNSFNFLPR